jgi:murein DD-endopeptidase MepM/ murein hydrolase activator NlpD
VKGRRITDKSFALRKEYLETKIDDVWKEYMDTLRAQGDKEAVYTPPADINESLKRFETLNTKFRDLLDERVRKMFAVPSAPRMWSEAFGRSSGGSLKTNFGEKRFYTFEGKSAGTSMHMGMDLASTANAPVTAANDGTVLQAGPFGIFGQTVIIDHGFGLGTLYAHLSSITVEKGAVVKREQQIGKTGSTGFADGDHLHFEIRLDGIPVTPIEWWDGHWIRDHIERKITKMKEDLGIIKPPEKKKRGARAE